MSSSHSVLPSESLKRTVLYSRHVQLGARIGPFAGWELPLYYSSILQEHQAVRTAVGLFDVSHLGHLELHGPGTASQLQLLFTQDLAGMQIGSAVYSPMLNPQGWIIDEMIIYRLGQERFRLVVNAANGGKVIHWLKAHLSKNVRIDDLREKYGTLAVQGPRAVELFSKISSMDFAGVPRYRIVSAIMAERSVWVARTGYTGEDGGELFASSADLPYLWDALLEAGKPMGIQPVGLGARDTLRLEAGLPLGGIDLDEQTTPLEAGLDWTIFWRKGPFMGREALEKQQRNGLHRRLAGFQMDGAGIPRLGYPIYSGEDKVGLVTSGTMLADGRGIGMGYLPPLLGKPGTPVKIGIHQRAVDAHVVQLPFYRRKK